MCLWGQPPLGLHTMQEVKLPSRACWKLKGKYRCCKSELFLNSDSAHCPFSFSFSSCTHNSVPAKGQDALESLCLWKLDKVPCAGLAPKYPSNPLPAPWPCLLKHQLLCKKLFFQARVALSLLIKTLSATPLQQHSHCPNTTHLPPVPLILLKTQ